MVNSVDILCVCNIYIYRYIYKCTYIYKNNSFMLSFKRDFHIFRRMIDFI